MISSSFRVALIGTVCAVTAWGHYTWIAASPELLPVGKPVTLQIGHGHEFPASEEAINARQLDLFAVSPSGTKTKLEAVASRTAVNAKFTAKESGLYRIAFVQDRGVSSRTPDGVKPGGRDRNPSAMQAFRTLRTAITYASTAKATTVQGKPLGLEFELSGALANGAWTLQLLKQGKPAAGVAIEVFVAGTDKPVALGKTGADGKTTFRPSTGAKGSALFLASQRDAAPAGAAYDATNYETSLAVSW